MESVERPTADAHCGVRAPDQTAEEVNEEPMPETLWTAVPLPSTNPTHRGR
ncbi:hypothetical protein FHS01_000100 [Longimicrobium terrae]|uniref:Uncharacterized protein n=1 Tax=Longimicrobium terrae TaxID=1639882 RepID=A0A841GWX2_9BACT|nr:hypothetical protein [Longimicrobium terrae]MBB6069016.1 hypothetical protein [Longimicrobium terrae]